MGHRLYLLDFDHGANACRVHHAVDQQGNVWCDLVDRGQDPVDGDLRATVYEKGKLLDLLFSGMSQLVVSNELYHAIRKPSWNMDHLAFKQADVMNSRGMVMAKYWIIHAKTRFDVVDYERAKFHYFAPPTPNLIRRVKSWVVRQESIPGCNLFRERYGDWMVSQSFVDLCKLGGFTGMTFRLLDVV